MCNALLCIVLSRVVAFAAALFMALYTTAQILRKGTNFSCMQYGRVLSVWRKTPPVPGALYGTCMRNVELPLRETDCAGRTMCRIKKPRSNSIAVFFERYKVVNVPIF